jgi:uncharacterized protein YndB with AHSA1/START domain
MADAVAEVSVTIDAEPSTVWRVLTDVTVSPEYTMGGAVIDTDWEVGAPITWSGEWDGQQFQDKGEILANDPGHRLSYSHWSPMSGTEDVPENHHVVTIVLEEEGERSTLVTLTQTNPDGRVTDDDREHRADFERNWSTMLSDLKSVVER